VLRLIVKLLIVAAILNALARTAGAAWRYYQLRDEAQQLIVFGARNTTAELHNQILTKAEELQVPLEPANLGVRRIQNRTFVDARYTQPVELFPRYTYPFEFSFEVEAFAVDPVTPEEAAR
jgi:hypothetical protein